MLEYTFSSVDAPKASMLAAVPANDNVDWTADLWLSARMFGECRRRYQSTDPTQLTTAGRIGRTILLRECLELIQYYWRALSDRNIRNI